MWRGPRWGVSNSGSRGQPLGEGGSGQRRGAQHEACVQKGAPTSLPGKPAQCLAGGWVELAGLWGGSRGRAGVGGQAASSSGQRTVGGAWNPADLGPTTSALALPPSLLGKVLMGPRCPGGDCLGG